MKVKARESARARETARERERDCVCVKKGTASKKENKEEQKAARGGAGRQLGHTWKIWGVARGDKLGSSVTQIFPSSMPVQQPYGQLREHQRKKKYKKRQRHEREIWI